MTDRSASAAELRATADALSAIGRCLELDVADVVAAGGPSTWRGPAAESHRGEARRQAHRVAALAVRLSRRAGALRQRAAEVEAAAVAAAEAEVARLAGGHAPPSSRPGGGRDRLTPPVTDAGRDRPDAVVRDWQAPRIGAQTGGSHG